jgi:aminobenzoyl-glutamate utilization protein B
MALIAKKKKIIADIGARQEAFWRISDAIWHYAELGLEEYNSSKLLSDTLESAGFQVDRGVAHMPTAFVATWKHGTGSPVIGLTAEYDALPNLSQKAGVPRKEPLVPGAPGHGCGHNTMAAMQALAAVSLRETAKHDNLNVTLKFFGCPAEEIGSSRPQMIQEGLFEGVDAVIDCHADFMFKTTYGMIGTALNSFEVTFFGKSAHAAWKPWMGRSAADAVELMHAGTERMREHIPPTSRVHWVTTFAGEAPNVVPDQATTWYFVRDLDENLESLVAWVYDCAKGAALLTQTRYESRVLAAVHQRFYNRSLAKLLFKNIQAVGKPGYTEEEETFARELQREAGFPVKGMDYPVALVNAEEDEPRLSSSDMGDVCLVVPTGQVSLPVWVPGTPAHHWTATATGATSIAHKGITAGAKVVALTLYDVLTDSACLPAIKSEFAELTARHPYRPFLDRDAKPPLGFYASIMEKYRHKLRP